MWPRVLAGRDACRLLGLAAPAPVGMLSLALMHLQHVAASSRCERWKPTGVPSARGSCTQLLRSSITCVRQASAASWHGSRSGRGLLLASGRACSWRENGCRAVW